MAKIRKNVSLEKKTTEIIKQIAKDEKRTESSVIDLAVQQLDAMKKAS